MIPNTKETHPQGVPGVPVLTLARQRSDETSKRRKKERNKEEAKKHLDQVLALVPTVKGNGVCQDGKKIMKYTTCTASRPILNLYLRHPLTGPKPIRHCFSTPTRVFTLIQMSIKTYVLPHSK